MMPVSGLRLDPLVPVSGPVVVEYVDDPGHRDAREAAFVEELLPGTAEEPLCGGAVGRTSFCAHRTRQIEGCAEAIPAQRNWGIVFRGVAQTDTQNVHIEIDGKACNATEITYDQQTLSLSVVVRDVPSAARLNVTIANGLQIAENPVEQDSLDVLLHAQMPYISKEHAMQAIREQGVRALGALRTFDTAPRFSDELFVTSGMPDSVISALEEILLRS